MALNRGGSLESTLHHLAENVFRHGRFVKGHAGLGNIGSTNDDLFGSPPGLGFLLAALGDVGMLQIEILLERNQLLLGKIDLVQIVSELAASSIGTAAKVAAAKVAATASIPAPWSGNQTCEYL